MPVLMVRYQVAEQGVAEVTQAVQTAFEAVRAQRPKGLRFSYFHRAGSTEFIALVELDEGIENPLFGIEAARALQAAVARWAVGEPPKPQAVERIGAYGIVP
ncbi:hypothetical protein [Myxococcus qinghaiensis]|uniref:hypothetical protein n=1 Tax=Myxococcus qinghaiensis TaxID=2906758 RepID=UPI0020A7D553|nr:hypothetical protein [Myxococcus qinghaiensis]MCP3164215.1 hypothetical protein [Myxococcus qinghaiensis]